MTDSDESLEEFLAKADAALEGYDQGYADATLRRLRGHLEELRSATDERASSSAGVRRAGVARHPTTLTR